MRHGHDLRARPVRGRASASRSSSTRATSSAGRRSSRRKDEPATRRLTCLTLDDPARSSWARSRSYDGDRCVGYVTSAAYGYTIGAGIAYAWLPERARRGRARGVQIDYFDQRVDAAVTAEPLFDPGMTRLRG